MVRALILVLLTLLPTVADAKRGRKSADECKENELRVTEGMVGYGGPGLGYEVTHVFPSARCVDVLKRTADESFALVVVDKERLTWVATKDTDDVLGEKADAKPVELPAPGEVVVLRETPLREGPSFEAKAAGKPLEKGAKLLATGRSPDGLWLFVELGGAKGWVSRFQTATELPKPESAPAASSTPWVIRQVEPAVPPVTPPAASVEKAKEAAAEGGGQEAPPATVPPVEEPAARPWVGRGHEVSFAVSVGQWSQRYLSDAQRDAFYKYELSSTGPAGVLSYAYRGDFPLVGDVRLGAGVFGFNLVPPGETEAVYTPVFTTDLAGHLGWRLYGDELVDVEAGAGMGLALVWVSDLYVGDDRIDAFTPGMYLDAFRPYVAARSRLGGGDFGMLSLEAAIPLGGYLMVFDPGSKFLADYGDACLYDQTPPPPEGAENPGTPPGRDCPQHTGLSVEQEPPFLHPAVGVEGRVRYAFPLGDVVRLRLGMGLGVRQAFVTGPGVRESGIYLEATNIDILGSFDLGADFSF